MMNFIYIDHVLRLLYSSSFTFMIYLSENVLFSHVFKFFYEWLHILYIFNTKTYSYLHFPNVRFNSNVSQFCGKSSLKRFRGSVSPHASRTKHLLFSVCPYFQLFNLMYVLRPNKLLCAICL